MLANIRNFVVRIPPLRRLIYVLVISAIPTTQIAPLSSNDLSRMATIQSLVEFHSPIIDHTAFIETIDKVFINGHFYSDKPPMPSIIGAAIYLPLHATGIRLHSGISVAYYLITFAIIKVLWILGIVAFYYALGYTDMDVEKRFLASLALGFGSLLFSWSTTFNNHALAASSLCIGFYFLLKARFDTKINLSLLIAGLFLSLAGTADFPTGIFYALFFLYVLRDARLRQGVAFYTLPLMVTVLPALALNFAIHQSIMPVQITRSYFEYPGSPWIGSSELSGMSANDAGFVLRYALLVFVGPRGFLLYNPLLAIALWGLVRTIRQKGTFYYEGIVVALGCSLIVLYYLLTTTNFGGWAYSIRWFVPMLPLLFFFLYPYFESYTPRRASAFWVLFCVSFAIAIVGAINPWCHATLSNVPFIANIRWLSAKLALLKHVAN